MVEQQVFENSNKILREDIYRQLIHVLEYETSPFYRPDDEGIYDYCYYIESEYKEYPFIGIKRIDSIDEDIIVKLHLFYWNRNDVPISILILPGEFRIYNNFSCRKGRSLLYNSTKGDEGSWLLDDLRASRVSTRVVWERLSELSNSSDRVDKQLLFNLKSAVVLAHTKHGMKIENAYNFMSQCIFVKYLEDRQMLTERAYDKWNVSSFSELLERKNTEDVYSFFSFLKERFNGDLFMIQKEALPLPDQLTVFCRFFKGEDFFKDGNSQLKLFPYDFSVIPIGLISNIYETFFSIDDEWKNEKKAAGAGAFYTPHYLADYMVQQSFSRYSNKDTIPCVLDPSCGSGVFLVSAFKQQIDILKKEKTVLDAETLSNLMANMIYGVDINLGALKISCFSLYIALLDELTPKDITENQFRFPNLIGKNLIEGSFFSEKVDQKLYKKNMDIIVGNPPWKSIPKSDHVSYCLAKNIPIADAQIAQAFISRASDFANEKTIVSLLVTNAIFTNKNSKHYLKYLLSKYRVEQVINLEAIKAQLFVHATYPCSILTYCCKQELNYNFCYYAFHPNMLFRLLHQFIYDKNDEIVISKHKFDDREYLWTILTYGDEFDIECIEHLKRFPMLSSSIDGKLEFVQGYITAKNGRKCPEFSGYKGGSLKGCFMPYGVNYVDIPEVSPDVLYDRPRDLRMYVCAAKVLIKRTYNENCWGAAYVSEPVIFSNDFSTFNDYTGKNTELLRYLEGILNSKVFRYYSFYMTKVKAAKKPEVVKEDVLRFPMPLYQKDNQTIAKLVSLVEQMEAVVHEDWNTKKCNPFSQNSNVKANLQKELDALVYYLYELDDFQISLIDEGINRFENKANDFAEEYDYQTYADCLCNYFNYYMTEANEILWKSQKQIGEYYTIVRFYFGIEDSLDKGLVDVSGMAGLERINSRLLIQNKIIMFENSGFSIIQTKDRKNWTIGKARKVAADITRQIMNARGDSHEN
ncbi:MAG: N-6 DNA methylase [Lachnospiraceae bacterium]|nr:N-6 DNA methylase [Lachnospiraceae bacterium]